MKIVIDVTSEVPLYQQLFDRIVEGIASGELVVSDPLPSTRQLAADFGINFHTVRKAYDLLRQQELIRLTRKSGAVVQRDPSSGPPAPGFLPDWRRRAYTLLAEAVAQGLSPGATLDTCREILDSFAVAKG